MGKPEHRWGKPDQPLNSKQLAFVEEYLKDGHATRAAIAAGYSEKRGAPTGSELLRDPRIAAILLARADELAGNIEAARIETAVVQQRTNELAEAAADQIAVELRGLSGKARALMTVAEGSGDIRTALQGLREISRLLELKAKLAGRIAGVQINLTSINVDTISDEDLEHFLERARDRLAKIRERELEHAIPPEQVERLQRAMVTRYLYDETGVSVTFDEVVEIVRAAKADRGRIDARVIETSASPIPEAPPAAMPDAESVAVAPMPLADIRDRAMARLDDWRR